MEVYNKNFITNVIARVDFDPILIIRTTDPTEFQEKIRNKYPRLEKIHSTEITITQGEQNHRQLPSGWRFQDTDKKSIILLTSDYITYEANKYVSYQEFGNELQNILLTFNAIYSPAIIKRIGLRYINQINLEGNPYDWNGLISDRLSAHLSAFTHDGANATLSRGMGQLHLKYDDAMVLLQYGIFNSQYPNQIAKKEFILDFDCSNSDENNFAGVIDKFNYFNEIIQNLFEQSIGEELRIIMRG